MAGCDCCSGRRRDREDLGGDNAVEQVRVILTEMAAKSRKAAKKFSPRIRQDAHGWGEEGSAAALIWMRRDFTEGSGGKGGRRIREEGLYGGVARRQSPQNSN